MRQGKKVDKVEFIQNACRGKTVLDMGCIQHRAEHAITNPNWLHQKIKDVAKRVVGLDYLESEVKVLKDSGFEMICADITKPIPFTEKFDVLVAGDLIEHLSNFDGFFENCKAALKPGGKLILTTPNPFYDGIFSFVSFSNNVLTNLEHTCWIDGVSLGQLAHRFGFLVQDIQYVAHSWRIENYICESREHPLDIAGARWLDNSFRKKLQRKLVSILLPIFYYPYRFLAYKSSRLTATSDYLAVLTVAD